MKQTLKTLALTSALTLAASFASAATAFTDPVGAMSITCVGGSDTIIGVPFAKAAEFQGAATTIDIPTGVISKSGAGFTNNQFQNLWYVRFTSGVLAGRYYTITSNDAGTITVDKNGEDWTGVTNTETFKIVKYWLVGELFPKAEQRLVTDPLFPGNTVFIKSVGTGTGGRQSQLLLLNPNGVGTNLAPFKTIYVNANGWISTANTTADSSANEILLPDTYFIVRHKVGSVSTTFIPSGSVETGPVVSNFVHRAGGNTTDQDNAYFIARPKDYALNDLAFTFGAANSGANFITSVGTGTGGRGDELLVYSTGAGVNKSPIKTYFRQSTGFWRSTSTGANDVGTDTLPAGYGFTIRKNGQTAAGTVFYSNAANY